MEIDLVLRWALLYAVLTALGAPVAAAVFPRFPDRGATFALPIAVGTIALTVFLVGHLSFGPITIGVGLVVLLIAAGISIRRGATVDRRSVGEALVVFLAGFGFLVLLRAYDPAVTPAGGEQFLHYGLLNAVGRADALPPEDLWYAGEPVRYYFAIPVMTTALAELTATPNRYAYNLALAGYFGILVVTAYGLAGAISAWHGRSRVAGGVLGVFFVAFAGNLATPVRLLFGLLPTAVAHEYGRAVFGSIRHNTYEVNVVQQSDPSTWSWFYDRYVVPETLQEFPLYSFVKADVHGHFVMLPWVVLAAALGYAYYLTPEDERRRRLALVYLAFPLVGGFHGVANTWSMPTVVGLAWLALTFGPANPVTVLPRVVQRLVRSLSRRVRDAGAWPPFGHDRPRADRVVRECTRTATAAVVAVVVAALSYVVASPFLLFRTPENDGIGFFPPRSPAPEFLLLYGGLLAVFTAYLVTRRRPPARTPRWLQATLVGTSIAVGALLVLFADVDVFVLVGPLLVGAWVLARTRSTDDRDQRAVGYESVLLIGGVGLLLALELVHARVWPPELDRWNTTLKVAIQAWTLSALAAGPIVVIIVAEAWESVANRVRRARASEAQSAGAPATGRWTTASTAARSIAIVSLVAVVMAGSATFGVLVVGDVITEDVFGDAEATLDAHTSADRWHTSEMEAIAWLDQRDGTPTIVSQPGHETYSFQNPASVFTGIPTVVGWDHQRGYRGNEAFDARAADVDRLYTGSWIEVESVLVEYDVAYVYVGPNEREGYGDDLRSFDDIPAMEVAFRNGAVTIYEVDHSALRVVLPDE